MLSGARFRKQARNTNTTQAVAATAPSATGMPAVPMMARVSVPKVSDPSPKPMNMTPEAKPVRSGNHSVTVAIVTLYPSPVPQPMNTP